MGHKFNTKDGALHILAFYIRTDNPESPELVNLLGGSIYVIQKN